MFVCLYTCIGGEIGALERWRDFDVYYCGCSHRGFPWVHQYQVSYILVVMITQIVSRVACVCVSCRMCVCRVTCVCVVAHVLCVMSHVCVSCHLRLRHVTYEWVTPCSTDIKSVKSYTSESECGMSHMNESWMWHVTYEWVMPHMSDSHVTYEWVMSHMSESCHTWVSHVTHEWVMSHMSESCHTGVSHVMYV